MLSLISTELITYHTHQHIIIHASSFTFLYNQRHCNRNFLNWISYWCSCFYQMCSCSSINKFILIFSISMLFSYIDRVYFHLILSKLPINHPTMHSFLWFAISGDTKCPTVEKIVSARGYIQLLINGHKYFQNHCRGNAQSFNRVHYRSLK